MRTTTAWIVVLWTVLILLGSCAERHVVKTPVPPEPQRTNALEHR